LGWRLTDQEFVGERRRENGGRESDISKIYTLDLEK